VRITASCHVANATPAAPIIQYATSPFVVFSICPTLRWDQVDQRLSLTQRDWQVHGTPVSIDVLKMQPEGGRAVIGRVALGLAHVLQIIGVLYREQNQKKKNKKGQGQNTVYCERDGIAHPP
jgi:hypothetical protein